MARFRGSVSSDNATADYRTTASTLFIALVLAAFGAVITWSIADRNRISELQAKNVERIVSLEARMAAHERDDQRLRERVAEMEREIYDLQPTLTLIPPPPRPKKEP